MTKKFHRRHFMVTAAAAVAASGLHTTELWGKTIKHKPLDPVNPDILFGTTSSIWGGAGVGGKKTRETPWAIKRVAELGLQGIEFYGDGIEQYRSNRSAAVHPDRSPSGYALIGPISHHAA